ncbi:uncharacterized protein BDW47DRAFT_101524 [Aspergillus candidus]|uniref:Uncharacterized protein n=1 Tax=Aspergillus candidus TaxID=41067 RepID=A0A2I2FHS4_ASPCN|nr:hypothetical protein BDW47DRAFT_101524 [Aspergillus candidus]PLB40172.1 hypothetical protein BDW47DRAFT_101524 [Aspergillus candidus]
MLDAAQIRSQHEHRRPARSNRPQNRPDALRAAVRCAGPREEPTVESNQQVTSVSQGIWMLGLLTGGLLTY